MLVYHFCFPLESDGQYSSRKMMAREIQKKPIRYDCRFAAPAVVVAVVVAGKEVVVAEWKYQID